MNTNDAWRNDCKPYMHNDNGDQEVYIPKIETNSLAVMSIKALADKIFDLQMDYNKACQERDECAAELLACETAYKKCVAENSALHLSLFHVENGCGHPDPEIRMLIRAALKAAQHKCGVGDDT